MLGGVKFHSVTSDGEESMRGDALQAAIDEDIKKGLIPFYVRQFDTHSLESGRSGAFI